MLSEEQLARYRQMSIDQRWEITEELMNLTWKALLELPYEERERRLQLAREEHELSSKALVEALSKLPR